MLVGLPPAPASAQVLDCGADEPEGWTVIVDASSFEAGQQFLCNFRIDQPKLISGTAITIEYYCSTKEAKERFDGVTKSTRKTETDRKAGES